jgi:hypothetical protein
MAFPTISDADTTNGTVAVNSASWTLTYPANIAANDLLILLLAGDGGSGTLASLPAGWVLGTDSTAANGLSWAKKKATGSETGTFSAGINASEQGGWRIFRIPASSWEGTLGTTFTGNQASNDSVAYGGAAAGASANPNPASFNPNNWDVEDTLWIVVLSADTSRTISVYPYADRNTADVSGGAGGATLGVCTTTSAAASIDPGTFTISASDDWLAGIIAVRPAAASTPPHPWRKPYSQFGAY